MALVAVPCAAIIVSLVVGAVLLLHRPTVEILVTDVSLILGVPEDGMTEVQAHLVLRNVGSSAVQFSFLTLFAYDPTTGTWFGTFSHRDVRLEPGGERTFSETTNVKGDWSAVAFTVKVFPSGSPSWERSLDPDQPVTWRI
jgi:hypothetical protein